MRRWRWFVYLGAAALAAALVWRLRRARGGVDVAPRPMPVIWKVRARASACTSTEAVTSLSLDPCYAPENRAQVRECSCRTGQAHVTYRIASPDASAASRHRLTLAQVEQELLLVFIHVNKAGGSTVKRGLLFPALEQNSWDGAALGTFKGWQSLGPPWAPEPAPPAARTATATATATAVARANSSLASDAGEEPMYVQCGRPVALPAGSGLEGLHTTAGCALRSVWGGMSMGLCDHFPGRPCVYLIVIRHPLKRAISNYNYVCIQGAEGRKKWTKAWKKTGECPLRMDEFMESGLAEPDFLLWRLTRGCDGGCGREAALANLAHPCLRFLLLEELDDGLRRLRQALGAPYHEAIAALLERRARPKNRSPYDDERMQQQLKDDDVMASVRAKLQGDMDIYKQATALYEEQWARPLASCNAIG